MPERARLWRKTVRRGLLIASYKRLEKRAMTPAVEAVRVSAHGAVRVPASQAAVPPSRSTLPGTELPRAKKPFVYVRRVASAMSDSLQPLDCGLPGFSVGEEGSSSQEYWSILASAGCHTFLELYIPAALAANTPEHLVLPEPLRPSSCTTSSPGPHRANPSPPGQPQEQSPVDDSHAEVEIEPQWKPEAVWLRK